MYQMQDAIFVRNKIMTSCFKAFINNMKSEALIGFTSTVEDLNKNYIIASIAMWFHKIQAFASFARGKIETLILVLFAYHYYIYLDIYIYIKNLTYLGFRFTKRFIMT